MMKQPSRPRILILARLVLLVLVALALSVSGLAAAVQPARAQDTTPVIEIVDVNPGQQIVVRGENFPSNLPLTAAMGIPGTLDPGVPAGSLLTPQSGTFVIQLRIPQQLANNPGLTVLVENQASGVAAYNTFQNVTNQSGDIDVGGGGGGVGAPACVQFYTIQPGETLADIALRFNTTTDRLFAINNLQDLGEIFAGQRICVLLETDIVLPPTGGEPVQPILAVVEVVPGTTVSVHGSSFPGSTPFEARIGLDGTQGINGIPVGSIMTPPQGAFQAQFTIPAALLGEERLVIRLENQTLGLFAYNSFVNDVPGDDPVLPITGGNPVLQVIDVDPGDDVTVSAQNFPAGATLNALIGPSGGGPFIQVAAVTVPLDGAFSRSFNLPVQLLGEPGLIILFEEPVTEFSISQAFSNLSAGDTEEDRLFSDPDMQLPPIPVAITHLNIDMGETATIAQNNSGLTVTESSYDGIFSVAQYNTDVASVDGLAFAQRLVRLGVTATSGVVLTDVLGLNYVFFEITEENRAAIDAGLLNIYYYDPEDAAWEQCDVQVQISGTEGGGLADRLACVIEDFGLFGLAFES